MAGFGTGGFVAWVASVGLCWVWLDTHGDGSLLLLAKRYGVPMSIATAALDVRV